MLNTPGHSRERMNEQIELLFTRVIGQCNTFYIQSSPRGQTKYNSV